MSGAEMEDAIEFLLGHHAKVSAEIQQLSAEIHQLTQAQKEQGTNLDKLSKTVGAMAVEMQAGFERVSDSLATITSEMREGFNNLIVANEVTRDLAQKCSAASHRH